MSRTRNSHQIIGRLGADPETRFTSNGKQVTSFSVATSDVWLNSSTGERMSETTWHHVVTFAALAAACAEYLSTGAYVSVEGSNRKESWTDDNGKHTVAKIYAREVIFLDPRSTTPSEPNVTTNLDDFDENEIPF